MSYKTLATSIMIVRWSLIYAAIVLLGLATEVAYWFALPRTSIEIVPASVEAKLIITAVIAAVYAMTLIRAHTFMRGQWAFVVRDISDDEVAAHFNQ